MGNYDIPGEPLPVFTKPCGCVMRLTPSNNLTNAHKEMTWTCIRYRDLDLYQVQRPNKEQK